MKQLFAIIAICIFHCSSAQTKPLATIPFELKKNCIYFNCKINGSENLRFLFDTGANGSVINEKSLSKVALKIDGETMNVGSNGSNIVRTSSGNTVTLDGIVKPNIGLVIIPYENADFDGVFGTDLMVGNIIEIDYRKSELRFYDRPAYKNDLADYTKVKLYLPSNYLSIKGSITIKGKTYSGLFGLDTGADNALIIASPFASKHDLIHKTPKIGSSTSQGSDGSTYESPLVMLPEVAFGKKIFYSIPAELSSSTEGADAVTDKAGFYGNSFLKRFNIVLDLDGGYIYLKPNKYLYTPFFD